MSIRFSRRGFLAASALATLGVRAAAAAQPRFSLNASTLFGQKLALLDFAKTAAKAGYDGIEPWMRDIETYVKSGGALADLRKQIADLNLRIENAIGFAAWAVDDDEKRRKGLEQFQRDMDLVAQLGGTRIAAPPVGLTGVAGFDVNKLIERYQDLLKLGDKAGVTPQVEIWGASKTLGKLEEAAAVVSAVKHPRACILADIYHMYKGGSDLTLLAKLPAGAVQMLHMNDYPADPPRATIKDSDRVYPGDGIAPVATILRDVWKNNPECVLSLELFNPTYWKQDALEVAKTGLARMKAAAAAARG